MTTIDHQQAAKSAAAEKIIDAVTAFVRDHKPISGGQVTKEALTAAAPHLRAAWAADLVEKIKAEINDVDWDYGLNADAYLNGLRRVIALLEGGGEDK